MANLIQLIDPDVIVLGGGVSASGELLASAVTAHLEAMSVDMWSPVKRVNGLGLLIAKQRRRCLLYSTKKIFYWFRC